MLVGDHTPWVSYPTFLIMANETSGRLGVFRYAGLYEVRHMARATIDKWLTEKGLLLIKGWAEDGLTDEQIAKRIGISRSTLLRWRKKEPVLQETLVASKEVADRAVENSLYRRALGYTWEEETRELVGGVLTVTKVVTRHVPAEAAAIIFWLKNRKPEVWREKRDPDQLEKTARDDGFIKALSGSAADDWEGGDETPE